MKQFILIFMAGVMLASSSFAMSPAYDDYGDKTYYSDVVEIAPDAEIIHADDISDWDYFWGTTLNPENTGWNNFWFQCNADSNFDLGSCIGTVFVGATAVAAAPFAVIGVAGYAATLAGLTATFGFQLTTVMTAVLLPALPAI